MDHPDWWAWQLEVTLHAEERMVERGLSEVDLRTMFLRATAVQAAVRPGRWLVRTRHANRPWIVVLEVDEPDELLVVVTAYRDKGIP